MTAPAPVPPPAAAPHGAFAPFRHRDFTVLWSATVISNVGVWMYNAAAGWLIAVLDPRPLTVSLVQVATMLPMALVALPAGALADIVDRRRLLIVVQAATMAASALLGLIVLAGIATPTLVLAFTFAAGVGAAMVAPAWQAVVPQLVPKADLPGAVALNSVGINISRALGPALAGLAIAALGLASPFLINAAGFVLVIGALVWWRRKPARTSQLPAERFGNAVRIGLRHARRNPHLRATLARSLGFFVFASAYWALLPLIARDLVEGGPQLYGLMLGAIGAGAVLGALALPRLKARLGADRLVAAATGTTAAALLLFAAARHPAVALAASVLAGAAWIQVLSSLNVSAQVALPDWVRGRGLAVFVTVMSAAMTLGSLLWGKLAGLIGLPLALVVAAAGLLAAVPLTRRAKLQTGLGVDLSPSMHWPQPVLSGEVAPDRGPVMVSIEYRIDPTDRDAFLEKLAVMEHERRRDGAYAWAVFDDAATEGRYVETFMVESWLEHLRQHERITRAARVLQDEIRTLNQPGFPKVTHLIATDLPRGRAQPEEDEAAA
ncbi:MFS transporter [Rhodoplanes sp. TEM]|uniref:MFS transporter n=1 Tax=Rhodoplanes tepidamans TaxID=200616 RepID=A0ABT5J8V3_RHOTP|nr:MULTISPECIES: MFS transporter [Rhodoplanes]MDC7786042.1 MFS transporter [Rhodoplanes tepidamans]MDC7983817.1 MFS transporter [Rhodoplanes sp. TEM]MDQ0354884.1 MFS family permease [Rhodoplanes tepidamans]